MKPLPLWLNGLVIFALFSIPSRAAEPTLRDQALGAMRKAAAFFHDRVSTRGGYLCEYSADLSLRYGELPARESQVWVQDPATPGVGRALLSAYTASGDSLFLRYAEDAARCLARGQMACGGWNYLIDFEPGSLETWYAESKVFTDYPEFMHFDGNATFDDGVTAGATRLLLRVYEATQDPAWLGPLRKTLDFTLAAQYPNGGWPQRFPLIGTGYEVYHTFNDDVITGNIRLMVEAWRVFGDPRYLESARRGTDFIVLSQHYGPQYGWGQQLGLDLRLAAARAFEPASLCVPATVDNIRCLMDMYEFTGDRRYLEPVPRALDWLDRSTSSDGRIGVFLEEGTNRPLAAKFEGDSGRPETIRITENLAEAMGGYGFEMSGFSTKTDRARYERLNATDWKAPAKSASGFPDDIGRSVRDREPEVRRVIAALDSLGRWTEDGRMYSRRFCFKNETDYEGPVRKNFWIRTGTFIRNMELLAEYVRLTTVR